ncbi:MAG: hypothetical protein R6U68_16265 [Desulfobacteraceae bacterium]
MNIIFRQLLVIVLSLFLSCTLIVSAIAADLELKVQDGTVHGNWDVYVAYYDIETQRYENGWDISDQIEVTELDKDSLLTVNELPWENRSEYIFYIKAAASDYRTIILKQKILPDDMGRVVLVAEDDSYVPVEAVVGFADTETFQIQMISLHEKIGETNAFIGSSGGYDSRLYVKKGEYIAEVSGQDSSSLYNLWKENVLVDSAENIMEFHQGETAELTLYLNNTTDIHMDSFSFISAPSSLPVNSYNGAWQSGVPSHVTVTADQYDWISVNYNFADKGSIGFKRRSIDIFSDQAIYMDTDLRIEALLDRESYTAGREYYVYDEIKTVDGQGNRTEMWNHGESIEQPRYKVEFIKEADTYTSTTEDMHSAEITMPPEIGIYDVKISVLYAFVPVKPAETTISVESGETPVPGGDYISILSVTPMENIYPSVPVMFSVAVEYSLRAATEGEINMGFNTEKVDS